MQDAAAAAAADSARSHKTTRVLVVDDTEDMLLVMTNYLVPNGYIVEMARSGEECLQILSARIGTDDVPEVVLLDIMMGEGISGVECCREIRKYRGEFFFFFFFPIFFSSSFSSTRWCVFVCSFRPLS